jgi:hypothetical protein
MNTGGRPTGSTSAEAHARKRKTEEEGNPALKQQRAQAEKQAKMNFFKGPAPPALGSKSPARPSVLGGSRLTHAMGWSSGDEVTLIGAQSPVAEAAINDQSPVAEASTAMDVVYPDAPGFKLRVANAIYTVKGQTVKWDGKRDFLCVCNGSNACKGGLKNNRCGAFSSASSSTGPSLSLASSHTTSTAGFQLFLR